MTAVVILAPEFLIPQLQTSSSDAPNLNFANFRNTIQANRTHYLPFNSILSEAALEFPKCSLILIGPYKGAGDIIEICCLAGGLVLIERKLSSKCV